MPQVKPPPHPSTSFLFNYSLTLQTFDVLYADLLINHHAVKSCGRLEADLHAMLISPLDAGQWSSFRMLYPRGNIHQQGPRWAPDRPVNGDKEKFGPSVVNRAPPPSGFSAQASHTDCVYLFIHCLDEAYKINMSVCLSHFQTTEQV